jgi:hypothetical protein
MHNYPTVINRYNQGFIKFGPMEQCNLGQWVKYDDYIKDFRELDNFNSQLIVKDMQSISEINNLKNKIIDLESNLKQTRIVCNCLLLLSLIITISVGIINYGYN